MSKLGFIEAADMSLATGATKTLVQLVAGTNHGLEVVAVVIGFNSLVAADEAIACRLQIQTSAGTSSASTKINHMNHSLDGHETFDTAGRDAFTVEPSKDTNYPTSMIHPTQGYELWCPWDARPIIGSAERIGIEVIAGALSVSLDEVTAAIYFKE